MPVGCFRPVKKHRAYIGALMKDGGIKAGLPENDADTDVVELHRKSDHDILGIIFSGGIDKPSKPHITSLRAGGVALRSDGLQVGDYINAVNGIQTEKLKHEEIITLMKNTGLLVQLEVMFPLPPRAPQSAFAVKCRKTMVSLTKDDGSLGMVIRGGVRGVRSKSRPLTITHMRTGGPAHRTGILRVEDRIVAINGINVMTYSVKAARQLISKSDKVDIIIEYDIAVMETIQNATGPLLVEIGYSNGVNLGITLGQTVHQNESVILIDKISPASISERCGALHEGDHLLAVNGVDITGMSRLEAEDFILSRDSKILQLEILPVGHLQRKTYATQHGSQESSLCHLDTSCYTVFSDEPQPPRVQRRRQSSRSRSRYPSHHRFERKASVRSSASTASTSAYSLMCHEEKMEVCLFPNRIGIGIMLHSDTLPSEMMDNAPYIGLMETNGSAERCGVLQEGDRLLAVNHLNLIGHSLLECKRILEDIKDKCSLHVAFDVADGVVPSSGVFQVKLFKRGGSLGITLAGITDKEGHHHIIISNVKRGSASYRSGAVHEGDEVLSIDNISLSKCTADDATQILQNTSDVVRVKIKKHDHNDTIDAGQLVFTVEIPKQNKSLGLTISGAEQGSQPIFISEIISGGVAESIGALRTGDRILAINGKSVKGHPVSYAIQQLTSSSDVTSLKICRDKVNTTDVRSGLSSLHPPAKPREYRSGQSGDSALESWDGTGSPSSNQGAAEMVTANTKSEWSQMINDLENVGRLDISGLVNNVTASRDSSSDHHNPSHSQAGPDDRLVDLNIVRQEHETFGFGLSSGLVSDQAGCYICAVGRDGPADRAGIKKYDRLIQVNDINVQNYSTSAIVPLIEESGLFIRVLVSRTDSLMESHRHYSRSTNSSSNSLF